MLICLITLTTALTSNVKLATEDMIMKQYEGAEMKQQYKVWHTIYNKNYDYNTIEGINKYKNFKANLEAYKAHNSAGNTCFTLGINEFSDLSHEEFIQHFNIQDFVEPEKKRKMLSLDEYDDDEKSAVEDHPWIKKDEDHPWLNREPLDFSEHLMGVENQGSCGSCWTYMVLTPIEARWNMKGTRLREGLSNQQLVDCDTKNKGCNGGWPTFGFDFYKTQKAAYETGYPYKGKKGTCKTTFKCNNLSPIQTTGWEAARSTQEKTYNLLKSGPLATAVTVDGSWRSYKSGILNKCSQKGPNHGVTITGYGTEGKCDSVKGYWIIQNSWGARWGDKGFIKIADIPSCHVYKYSWAPKF